MQLKDTRLGKTTPTMELHWHSQGIFSLFHCNWIEKVFPTIWRHVTITVVLIKCKQRQKKLLLCLTCLFAAHVYKKEVHLCNERLHFVFVPCSFCHLYLVLCPIVGNGVWQALVGKEAFSPAIGYKQCQVLAKGTLIRSSAAGINLLEAAMLTLAQLSTSLPNTHFSYLLQYRNAGWQLKLSCSTESEVFSLFMKQAFKRIFIQN